ncbi:ladderlectin-like [Aplochiton taeniatus]
MNWITAQSYCRQNYLDLARVRNEAENQVVNQLMVSGFDRVWIGFFREPWSSWSDGSKSSFRNWKKGTPDNAGGAGENCAAASVSNGGQWNDWRCDSNFTFVCYDGELS